MIRSIEDVQIALRKVENELNSLLTRDLQLNGRRVTGSGDAKDDSDLVNLKLLKNMLSGIHIKLDSVNARLTRVEARLDAGGL